MLHFTLLYCNKYSYWVYINWTHIALYKTLNAVKSIHTKKKHPNSRRNIKKYSRRHIKKYLRRNIKKYLRRHIKKYSGRNIKKYSRRNIKKY